MGVRKPTKYHVCELFREPYLRLSQILRYAEDSLLALQIKADRSPDPDVWKEKFGWGYRETILKLKAVLQGGLDYER